MKSYDETIESIFRKYDERVAQKKRRAAIFRRTAAIIAGTAAVIGIGLSTFVLRPPKKPLPGSSIISETTVTTAAETEGSTEADSAPVTAATGSVTEKVTTAASADTSAPGQTSTAGSAAAADRSTTAAEVPETTAVSTSAATSQQTATTTVPGTATVSTSATTSRFTGTTQNGKTTTASPSTTTKKPSPTSTATWGTELPMTTTTAVNPQVSAYIWTEVEVSDTIKTDAPYVRDTSFDLIQSKTRMGIVSVGVVTECHEYRVTNYDENGNELPPQEFSIITFKENGYYPNYSWTVPETRTVFYPFSLSYFQENGVIIREGCEYLFFLDQYPPPEFKDMLLANNIYYLCINYLDNAYNRVMAINGDVVTSYDFTQFVRCYIDDFYSAEEVWDYIPEEVKSCKDPDNGYCFFDKKYISNVVSIILNSRNRL